MTDELRSLWERQVAELQRKIKSIEGEGAVPNMEALAAVLFAGFDFSEWETTPDQVVNWMAAGLVDKPDVLDEAIRLADSGQLNIVLLDISGGPSNERTSLPRAALMLGRVKRLLDAK